MALCEGQNEKVGESMGMKYFPTKGVYKAGNNCTFNPETCEAYSYGWWRFVSYQHGVLIFNDYQYSATTRQHQSKVKRLLAEIGLEIGVVVESRDSIPTLSKKSDLTKYIKACESEKLERLEAKRMERNRRARERRAQKKNAERFAQGLRLVSSLGRR